MKNNAKKNLAALCIGTSMTLISGTIFAATLRDNIVEFDGPALQAASFSEQGHAVTKGQPYAGTTATVVDGQIQIKVRAGRKNSESVANWFKTQTQGGQTVVCDSAGTYPKKLNFAVQGDLSFTMNNRKLTCKDLIFAQGHFGVNNNWWVSSPTMKGAHVSITGATTQFCSAAGTPLPVAIVFTPKTPCVSHFSIAPLN